MSSNVQENRVRRMAQRQGLQVMKSRRRDVRAIDYGTYWVVDPYTNGVVLGSEWGFTLDEVEAFLTA